MKTVAFIGFNDAYGEGWYQEFTKVVDACKLSLVANERYSRTDTSVIGQVPKIIAAKSDAALIARSGTPPAMPHVTLKEWGYADQFYQAHGVANNDFLHLGGKTMEATFLPTGPMLVAAQLPDNSPSRSCRWRPTSRSTRRHTGKGGSVARFGGRASDVGLLVQNAVPVALKKAQSGSREFRSTLRKVLEATKELVGVHGVFHVSPNDRLGFDQRARVMAQIDKGAWKMDR